MAAKKSKGDLAAQVTQLKDDIAELRKYAVDTRTPYSFFAWEIAGAKNRIEIKLNEMRKTCGVPIVSPPKKKK